MQNQPPVQTAKSSTGLDENIAALLSYVFGWVSGLIFFLMEKDSRLVRFHAMQSILLNAVALVIGFALMIVWFVLGFIVSQISGFLSILVGIVIWLIVLAFWLVLLIAFVMCLIKAYQKQFFKLPLIGNFAEKFSTK
jgi:uncharacterized membrane protein